MMNWGHKFISLLALLTTVPFGSQVPVADVQSLTHDETPATAIVSNGPQKTYLDREWLQAAVGPWGALEYRRYYLDYPKQFIQSKASEQSVKWYGGRLSGKKFQERVAMGPFTSEEKALWAKSCTCLDQATGLSIYPSRDFRWILSERSRSLLYNWLAAFPQNDQQYNAFTHTASSDWLQNAGVRHELVDAVKALSYQSGMVSKFSDFDLLEDYFSNKEERASLLSVLNRQPYCEIRVNVPNLIAKESFMAYWGIHEQREKLEHLLADSADGTGSIRLEQLLPIIPASRLNTYPALPAAMEVTTPKENCFWTAFNFFSQIPDERLSEGAFVAETLYNSYQQVSGGLEYGDIIMMTDDAGYPMHAAVYLAADFVYTKNGGHETRPWVVMKLNDLETIYSDHGYRVTCYRKKAYHDLIFQGLSNRLDLTQNDYADHFVFQPNRLVNGQYTK